jgi:hypothetical protein
MVGSLVPLIDPGVDTLPLGGSPDRHGADPSSPLDPNFAGGDYVSAHVVIVAKEAE